MGQKKLLSIGFEIPGGEIEYTPFKSKRALLDYDIAIIKPSLYGFSDYGSSEYQGKRCLSDSSSFSLKEHLEHWRRETMGALRAGKTIFILLDGKEDVFVATGTVEHSGTGRNSRTTRHVEPLSNYSFLSGELKLVNSEGFSMTVNGKNSTLAVYWATMAEHSRYRVLIEASGAVPLIMAGDQVASALIKYKNIPGSLIFLPSISTEDPAFTQAKDDKNYWSKKGTAYGKKFSSCLFEIDKSLRESNQRSPKPDWVGNENFLLNVEQDLQTKMLEIETEIEKLQKNKEKFRIELEEKTALKALLYEQGKPLENAVLEALKVMGFSATPFANASSEFDVVFESPEGRLIGEVEGKDNKPVSVEKFRQLQSNINEDFQREEIHNLAKGALIGNAFRITPPNERTEFFTDKCLTSAKANNTALIRTVDLYQIVRQLCDKYDEGYAKNCRLEIVNTAGIVNFPKYQDV